MGEGERRPRKVGGQGLPSRFIADEEAGLVSGADEAAGEAAPREKVPGSGRGDGVFFRRRDVDAGDFCFRSRRRTGERRRKIKISAGNGHGVGRPVPQEPRGIRFLGVLAGEACVENLAHQRVRTVASSGFLCVCCGAGCAPSAR